MTDWLEPNLFSVPVGQERDELRIEAVVDHFGSSNGYTPGGLFTVRGGGFGHFEDPPRDVGIFLCGSRRHPMRAYRYLGWRETEITGIWPVGIHQFEWLLLATRTRNCLGQARLAFLAWRIGSNGIAAGHPAKAAGFHERPQFSNQDLLPSSLRQP